MPASAPEGDSLPQTAAQFGLGSQHLLDFNGIDGAAPGAGTATELHAHELAGRRSDRACAE